MVRIGTWNLENLFLPGGEAGPTTDEAYAAKLTALADTIRDLAPDVLAVQEVGGPPGSEIGTGGYEPPDRGDGQRLWNLAARILPADQRFSRVYRGRPELIDHILVSHLVTHAVVDGGVTAVVDGGVTAVVDGGVTAVVDGGVTAGPAAKSVGDDPNARRNEPGSDHRPLVATIRFAT